MKQTIYIYKEVNTTKYKIGKADQTCDQPNSISINDIAIERIKRSKSAGVSASWEKVYVFDITNCNFKSLEVEQGHVHLKLSSRADCKRIKHSLIDNDVTLKSNDTEWFEFAEGITDYDVISIVGKLIEDKIGIAGKQSYSLRSYQQIIKEKIIKLYNSDIRNIALELCPRAGKTILTLDTYNELGFEHLIIPAYELTVFASFKKELSKWSQLNKFRFVEISELDEDMLHLLRSNTRCVIALSLHLSEAKTLKIVNTINSLSGRKLVIVDEADRGTHTDSKQNKLVNLSYDLFVDMSGTQITKVIQSKKNKANIEHITLSYSDMLLAKRKKHPEIYYDSSLDEIPDPYMYRLVIPNGNFNNMLMQKYKAGISWNKLTDNIKKNKVVIQALLRALYLKNSKNYQSYPELISLSLENRVGFARCDVSMIFCNFQNNKQFKDFIEIANQTLSLDYVIVEINSTKTSNKKAELEVKEIIERAKSIGKKVIIVSKDMASRSFTIPELDTVILMYDNGGAPQTSQKISRAFSSGSYYNGEIKDKGSVVSLSFNNSRTHSSPIDYYLASEAVLTSNENESFQKSLQRISNCWNVFEQDANGNIASLSTHDYASNLLKSTSIKDFYTAYVDIDLVMKMADSFDFLGDKKKIRKIKNKPQDNDFNIKDVKSKITIMDYISNNNPTDSLKDKEGFRSAISNFIDQIEELTAFNGFRSMDLIDIVEEIINCEESEEIINQIESYYSLSFPYICRIISSNQIKIKLVNTILEEKHQFVNSELFV